MRYIQFFTGGNVEFADELVDDFVSRYIAHLAVLWWRHLVSSLKIHRDHVRCFYRGISQRSVSMVMNNSLKHKQCNVTLNNVQFSYFYFFKTVHISNQCLCTKSNVCLEFPLAFVQAFSYLLFKIYCLAYEMRIRLTSIELLNQLHTRVVSNDILDCFYD